MSLLSSSSHKPLPYGTKVYIFWFVLFGIALCPLIDKRFRPIWRIIATIGPTLLALDMDAGNHYYLYVIKALIWLATTAYSVFALFTSNGFRQPSPYPAHWQIALSIFLFMASCICTCVGHYKKRFICALRPLKPSAPDFHPIDTLRYFDYEKGLVRTTLNNHDYHGVEENIPKNPRMLKPEHVVQIIYETSLLTEYVMRSTFKSPGNKVYVFSYVTMYRARLLTFALVLAGILNIGVKLFSGEESSIIQALILWLTLPSITLPSILRHLFGQNVRPLALLKGFLPVENDRQMAKRLGITLPNLYAGLTNAYTSEGILTYKSAAHTMLQNRLGVGSVNVLNYEIASNHSGSSLLRKGEVYIRISDGKRFHVDPRKGLQPISTQNREMLPKYYDEMAKFHTKESIAIRCAIVQKRPYRKPSSLLTNKDVDHEQSGMNKISDEPISFYEVMRGIETETRQTDRNETDGESNHRESLKECMELRRLLAKEYACFKLRWSAYKKLDKTVEQRISGMKAKEILNKITKKGVIKVGPYVGAGVAILVLEISNDKQVGGPVENEFDWDPVTVMENEEGSSYTNGNEYEYDVSDETDTGFDGDT